MRTAPPTSAPFPKLFYNSLCTFVTLVGYNVIHGYENNDGDLASYKSRACLDDDETVVCVVLTFFDDDTQNVPSQNTDKNGWTGSDDARKALR